MFRPSAFLRLFTICKISVITCTKTFVKDVSDVETWEYRIKLADVHFYIS